MRYVVVFVFVAFVLILIMSLTNKKNNISKEQAVDIAIEVAEKEKFPDPEIMRQWIKDNAWEIDIQSKNVEDIYMHVRIDIETGNVIEVLRGSRA